ncbi:MAG: hypothetical protein WDN48_05875 [Pseudolabrys sp.]
MSKQRLHHVLRDPYLAARLAAALEAHSAAEAQFVAADQSADRGKLADAAETFLRTERQIGQILVESQRRKDAWIAQARKAFSPSYKESCAVCGKFKSIAHAHHVVPLSEQYDRGFEEPDQEHVWLCPNHHAIIHVLIYPHEDMAAKGRVSAGPISDLEEGEMGAVMALLGRSGRGK